MECRKCGGFPCYTHSGFILVEALVVVLLLSLALGMALPALWNYQEERELAMAAEEVAAAIRQTETEARSYTTKYGNITDKVVFYCGPDSNGRVSYYARRGSMRVKPKGTLPKNITAHTALNLTFRKDGYAGASSQYTQTLQTRDGRYRRTLTVAVYTGRVRIEES